MFDFKSPSFCKIVQAEKVNIKSELVFRFKNILTISIKSLTFLSVFLVAPNGKILSMSRQKRGETDLREKKLSTKLKEFCPCSSTVRAADS